MSHSTPITIRAFGIIAEKLATEEVEVYGIHDTDGILEWIRTECPALKGMYIGIAVNRTMVTQNTVVTAESDIALLPPFSGG